MRRPSRVGLSVAFVAMACAALPAQNLDAIGREKPVTVSGGLTLSQILHTSSSGHTGRAPYSFYGSGSMNVALYGWNIPLAFTVSNHQTAFSQPFNRYAVHPTWKWITVHAGHTSMSYSPYTVNGHVFLGGGIDLEPGDKWSVSGFGGRLLKARQVDDADPPETLPVYQRLGYGMKARLGKDRDFVELIVFHAEDVEGSIPPPPDSAQVTPHENAVASIGVGKTFLRRLYFGAEVATSALTRDVRAGEIQHNHILASGGWFFRPRLSSSYYKAMRASVDYQDEAWRIGIAWERIDPEYRTLGAYYFNNDLENVTFNASVALFKNKMNVNGNVGLQHDNVANQKMSTMQRAVGALQMSYTPSQKFNANLAVSTFQTHTYIRPAFEAVNQLLPYENPDTLTFTQIARSASLSGTWILHTSQARRQHIMMNANWQDAADQQGQAPSHAGTEFINISVGYSLTLVPSQTTVSLNVTTSRHEGLWMHTRTMGPTASVSRTAMNRRLRLMLSTAWNYTTTNGDVTQTVANARVNASWQLWEKHQLTCSFIALRRTFADTEKPPSADFTGTVGYSYTFGRSR